MQMSDDQMPIEEQEERTFRSIVPGKKYPQRQLGQVHGKLQISQRSRQIRKKCQEKIEQILTRRIQDTVTKVFKTIRQNWKKQNSIVIALNIKRNQKNDLKQFIDQIKKFQYPQGKKIKSLSAQQLKFDDVRDIALEILIKQDNYRLNYGMNDEIEKDQTGNQINLQSHINIYVNKKITNLSQQNIHVFQKSVLNANYAVILPTFQSLKIIDGQGILQQNEKYFFEAYNNKQLFIEFFYRCIVSNSLFAYLPKQILGIIKLYDYYPISYKQGCEMLIYAIQVFNQKCKLKSIAISKKEPFEIKQLVRIFNKTWKHFWDDEEQVAKYNYQQLSYVFLDPDAIYCVSQNKIQNFIKKFSVSDIGGEDDLTDKGVYESFIKKFRKKLLEDKNLKHLAEQLEIYDQNSKVQEQVKKKKNQKDRFAELGFNKKHFKSDKQYFQEKITKVFKKATEQIRKQAQYISWSQINVFENLRPELVLDTLKGVLQDSQFRDVFDSIRSGCSIPMGRLIGNFPNMQIGKLIYIIRCLELKGLIEVNKNTLRPSLMTDFFQKSSYRMANEIV